VKPLAVARKYARALADVAGQQQPESLEKVTAEISLAAKVLGVDGQIVSFFDDPSVRSQDKDAAARTLARQASLGDLSLRFLAVLIENRRISSLPEIATALRKIKDERMGVIPAETTLAVSPSEEEIERLRGALERMTGSKVRLTVKIDPQILGGARTRVGSQVYDGTLRHQLTVLRKRLVQPR
jgi:F-type H+-transporting ATPase subunit delta